LDIKKWRLGIRNCETAIGKRKNKETEKRGMRSGNQET
jgi:hypothetical protein